MHEDRRRARYSYTGLGKIKFHPPLLEREVETREEVEVGVEGVQNDITRKDVNYSFGGRSKRRKGILRVHDNIRM